MPFNIHIYNYACGNTNTLYNKNFVRSLSGRCRPNCMHGNHGAVFILVTNAKMLLPLTEDFQMTGLRKRCETALLQAFKDLRKRHHVGSIPEEVNEEYLILADKYSIRPLLQLCIEEYVANPDIVATKSATTSDKLSENVKLLILQKKLSKLNYHLEKERRYKSDAETKAHKLAPKTDWRKYWHQKGLTEFPL